MRRRKRWRKDGEARGREDSASQPRLPLFLSRQGAAEGFRPPVAVGGGDGGDGDELAMMIMKMICVAWLKVKQWQAW